jgi:hypothetical protein
VHIPLSLVARQFLIMAEELRGVAVGLAAVRREQLSAAVEAAQRDVREVRERDERHGMCA